MNIPFFILFVTFWDIDPTSARRSGLYIQDHQTRSAYSLVFEADYDVLLTGKHPHSKENPIFTTQTTMTSAFGRGVRSYPISHVMKTV
jgi:hypothetical protein